ncbi:MAG TPA: hypothetical protein VF677_03265 [Flavobacterium sp.]
MKALKNILIGFLVSFLGSIPLGYLNVIGYEIYAKSGIEDLVYYLFGVIIVEAVVIYCTLIFAHQLVNNKKLIKVIEVFSILFMLLLAYSFYSQGQATATSKTQLTSYIGYTSFIIGFIFSCLNFIQIPFWTGWNIYLINGKYITVEKKLRFLYLLGTLIGTFLGMLSLVLFLNLITSKTDFLSRYLMSGIIPLFFLVMALYQLYQFIKKYYYKRINSSA